MSMSRQIFVVRETWRRSRGCSLLHIWRVKSASVLDPRILALFEREYKGEQRTSYIIFAGISKSAASFPFLQAPYSVFKDLVVDEEAWVCWLVLRRLHDGWFKDGLGAGQHAATRAESSFTVVVRADIRDDLRMVRGGRDLRTSMTLMVSLKSV